MNPNESRTRACKLAEECGWFLGQDKDTGKPVLRRPGHAPEHYRTWLIALTEVMRLREKLPRGQPLQPAPRPAIPVAKLLPPETPPMARIVEVDKFGRIRRYL